MQFVKNEHPSDPDPYGRQGRSQRPYRLHRTTPKLQNKQYLRLFDLTEMNFNFGFLSIMPASTVLNINPKERSRGQTNVALGRKAK